MAAGVLGYCWAERKNEITFAQVITLFDDLGRYRLGGTACRH